MKWISAHLARIFGTWRSTRRLFVGSAIILMVALLLANLQSYARMRDSAISRAVERIQLRTQVFAAVLEGRLELMVAVAETMAAERTFREAISDGRWDEAALLHLDTIARTDVLARIFLTDTNGVQRAAEPELADALGVDFSHRQWYREVMETRRTVVTDAYLRFAEPQINVVAVGTPVYSLDNREIIGILVLQLPTEEIFAWTRELSFESESDTLFIDSAGHVIAESRGAPAGPLVGIHGRPEVDAVLAGEDGANIRFFADSNEEKVSAYAPVRGFGWGVIVDAPTRTALHDIRTAIIEATYGFIGLFGLVFAAVMAILYLSRELAKIRFREHAYLENAGDGIVVVDTEWNVVSWNRMAMMMTGKKKSEVLGKPLKEVLPLIRAFDRRPNYGFIERAVSTRRPQVLENSTVLVRADGTEMPVADSAAPIITDEGKVVGVIIVFRDATKEMEYRLVRSSFAYASHQLRTPVTRAMWAIDAALEEGVGQEEARARMRDAELAMRSVHKLVTELTVVSELDQHMVIPRPESLSLTKVVIRSADERRSRADKNGISVEFDDIHGDADVMADPRLINKIVDELLENAIDYNRPHGKVGISIRKERDGVLLSVSDQGIGIPPDQKSLVFTKFFRGSNVPEGVIGAGLGLYVAAGYAELMNGRIWFESEEGSGTVFHMYLPSPGAVPDDDRHPV